MSWWEANIARKRNITDTIGNISRTAGSMGELAEAQAQRRQQALQGIVNIFQNLAGRKHEMKKLEKEYGLRGAEQEKERGWRTGEAEKERAYGTSEREAGQQFRTEHELPWQERIGRASRSQQFIGTDASKWQEMLREAYGDWAESVVAQNPEWQVQDEYGAVVGYKIPPDVHDKFIDYALAIGIPENMVRAYVESLRGKPAAPAAPAAPAQAPAPAPSSRTTPGRATSRIPAADTFKDPAVRALMQNLQEAGQLPNLDFHGRKWVIETIDAVTKNPDAYRGGSTYLETVKKLNDIIQRARGSEIYGLRRFEGL